MAVKNTSKLRQSFAIAGAAVVLPLLAVFLFNTLWGYLPLRRDVGKVPYFVHVTNSMRDLEVAVLRSALVAHVHLFRREGTASPEGVSEIEASFEAVKQGFTTVRQSVGEWPDLLDRTYQVYAQWLLVREQARELIAAPQVAAAPLEATGSRRAPLPDAALRVGDPATVTDTTAAMRAFDASIDKTVGEIETMIEELTVDVNARLTEGRLNSQRIYGLTIAIGLMVIMFIMYVNLRLARYVVDPVNGIVGSMTQFRKGNYSARTGVHRRDEIGALAHAFNAMAEDIEQTHEHLASLSERDPLTGMLNRRGFDPRFERHLQQAEAAGRNLTVIMVDIDHFKSVNDTYGHAVGDQVLVAVSDTIRNCLRAGDFSARFGGEEFVVCMPGEGRETGMAVAERIREAVSRLPLCDTEGNEFSITVSAGVAVFPENGRSRNEILHVGDEALYAAKSGGRNRVVLAGSEAAEPLRKAG